MPLMILLRLLLTGPAPATGGVRSGPADAPRRPLPLSATMGRLQAVAAQGFSRSTPGLRPLPVLSGPAARFWSRCG